MDLPFQVPPSVTLELNLAPATWINDRLYPTDREVGVRVGEIIPIGFAAYARIFHPARHHGGGTLLWAELAERHARPPPRDGSRTSSERST